MTEAPRSPEEASTAALAACRAALERSSAFQAATADVLRMLSNASGDARPVFDMIAERAKALSGARIRWVLRAMEGKLYLESLSGLPEELAAQALAQFPLPLDRRTPGGRAIFDRRPVQIADLFGDPDLGDAI